MFISFSPQHVIFGLCISFIWSLIAIGHTSASIKSSSAIHRPSNHNTTTINRMAVLWKSSELSATVDGIS
jgi:hypothetical protein